jgi:hypothetical protein
MKALHDFVVAERHGFAVTGGGGLGGRRGAPLSQFQDVRAQGAGRSPHQRVW